MDLKHLALSESGFLFDSISGFTYTVNKTGTMILKGVIENKPEEEIVTALTEVFDIDGKTAQRDVHQYMHFLREAGLLPNE